MLAIILDVTVGIIGFILLHSSQSCLLCYPKTLSGCLFCFPLEESVGSDKENKKVNAVDFFVMQSK